jgi:hypothetical protein
MKRYLLILFLLPGSMLAQQQKIDSIKFELIKATVHFYATDSKLNNTGIVVSDCKVPDYTCLKGFSDSIKLEGVSAKITKWSSEKCETSEALQKLKGKILVEVTGGEKEYRKLLPSYKDYIARLDEQIATLQKSETGTPNNQVTDTGKKGATVTNDGTGGPITDKGNATGFLTWIALIAGFGGLGLSGWLYTRKPKKIALTNTATATDNADKLEGKIATINTQLPLKADATALAALQQRVDALEKQWQQVEKRAQQSVDPPATVAKAAPAAPVETTFYAKLPDLPNGFSNDILKNEQNGEQVYEIIVRDNMATYSVSIDSGAQGYALNDVNYILSRACTLTNQPFSNCRINTREKGTLTKMAEGWMLDKKAVVEFI